MADQPQTIGMYNILRPLGAGGMGIVYLGEHTIIHRQVAIKVIKANLEGQSHLSRFIREAVLLSELAHPNIITLYEVSADGPLWYFAMEYMPGGSVQDVLQQRRLDWREATTMLLDACRGLQAAHQRQILHRDVKPSNLLLDKEGRVKLADFGLAKARQESATPLSTQGVLGTPRYMSPEQCRAESVTERSDIYSLGGTYYTFLTGTAPFAHATEPMQMMFAHCESTLDLTALQKAHIPAACIRIVERAMAKSPRQRYPDCAALIADLEAALTNPTATTPRQEPQRRPSDLAAILPLDEGTDGRETSRRGVLLAGASLTALAVVGGVAWWRWPKKSPPDAPVLPTAFTVPLPEAPLGLQFSPDGRWLAASFRSGPGGVRVWDATTGTDAGHFWPTVPIQQLAWSADSTMLAATASGLGRAHLLQLPNHEYTRRHEPLDRDFAAVATWHHAAPFVVLHDADGGGMQRWATLALVDNQLREGPRRPFTTAPLVELVATTDGQTVYSTHRDGQLHRWRVAPDTLTLAERLAVPHAVPDTFRLVLNSAQDRLAVSAGKSVWLYPVPLVQGQQVPLPHDAWSLQFTPDGHHLYVAGSQLSVIDVATAQVVRPLGDVNETIFRLALHPTGTHMALSMTTPQGKRVDVRPLPG